MGCDSFLVSSTYYLYSAGKKKKKKRRHLEEIDENRKEKGKGRTESTARSKNTTNIMITINQAGKKI